MSVGNRKTIGVYTPYLQGFYFGELVIQIQQYCHLKGYNFTVIKTDGFGAYTSDLHTEHLDAIIILRNAIHAELAAKLVARGKPVVSIAYDYFPLNIPVITCDNDLGVELAFNHLLSKGHRKFVFVGDLSQYDIRKRFEAFCDQHEINQLPIEDDNLITVRDTLFSGGHEAAVRFHEGHFEATGIVCGASLTSIGFSKQITNLRGDISDLSIVGFDAISLVPICEPSLAMVDQNLHLIAFKAISVLESIESGDNNDRKHLVEPKLITPATDFMQAENAFLATSTEMEELHNANYMKSIISNLYEWPKSIAESNLDSLMTISPLFENHLKKACYGRVAISKDNQEYVKTIKIFTANRTQKIDAADKKSISPAAQYPNEAVKISPFLTSSVHLPITHNGRIWSVLSAFGSLERNGKPASFSAFCVYLDDIATHLQMKMLREQGTSILEPEHRDSQAVKHGLVTWHSDVNETHWDDAALAALGFVSELEKNIYRHMDISDRAHSDDEAVLSQLLVKPEGEALITEIRFKHRNKHYITCEVYTEKDSEGVISLYLTPLDAVG